MTDTTFPDSTAVNQRIREVRGLIEQHKAAVGALEAELRLLLEMAGRRPWDGSDQPSLFPTEDQFRLFLGDAMYEVFRPFRRLGRGPGLIRAEEEPDQVPPGLLDRLPTGAVLGPRLPGGPVADHRESLHRLPFHEPRLSLMVRNCWYSV
jgi:hypothetical protein